MLFLSWKSDFSEKKKYKSQGAIFLISSAAVHKCIAQAQEAIHRYHTASNPTSSLSADFITSILCLHKKHTNTFVHIHPHVFCTQPGVE